MATEPLHQDNFPHVWPLAGKVCIVTGATRGIGKGIALQLGEAGATVYITGRTLTPKGEGVGGSLQETSEEVKGRGGKCIPIQCDHGNDGEIKQLFEKVKEEQNGRLDILVNNAFSAVRALSDSMKDNLNFWEEDIGMWDTVNQVGLRGHYLASVYAARLMVPAKQGLIVNVSSPGGLVHMLSPPYCIGKSGCDRMAVECAIDLKKHNIAYISLWPGPAKTELVNEMLQEDTGFVKAETRPFYEHGETSEYAGKAIVHLATDPNIMQKSGKLMLTSSVAEEFGFCDIDGTYHYSIFSLKQMFIVSNHPWMAAMTPAFIRMPKWMIAASFHHF
ncbi:dehydrogenase/reductase SDR family member 1-like [Amphiura filiformis]|uniref:dehydrogenase/reductase SDR family member 1-like n=1 Tax=Amphiura filiformis TaxID=82378 RepID=UPI003B20FE8F